MAENVDDGEFWLPSKFLADEETVNESDESVKDLFPCEFPYEFGISSDSSSPVESVIGSTETESDEDELLAEVTRQIASIGVNNKPNVDETTKGLVQSGSPQSTLSPIGYGYQQGPARVPSPPFNWEFEIARTRMQQDAYQQRLILYQKLQALQQLKQQQQQLLKKQSMKGNGGFYKKQQRQHQGFVQSRGYGNPVDLSASAWPTLVQAQQQQRQQQQRPGCGSGMHAVFIGGSGRKSECAGTGVFLPRPVGAQPESRKKPGSSSSVILPAKVVKALNLDLGELGSRPQHYAPNHAARGFRTEKDLDFVARAGGSQQWAVQQEYRLPQEWTY